jgi:hypothetical protein
MREINVRGHALIMTLLCGVTTGCAGRMLNGKMYSVADNVAMPMQIQLSYGHGKMTAYNPKTDERFEGTYTGVRQGQTQVTNGWMNSAWAGSAQVTAMSETRSNLATAIATLIGDKGTTLDCVMQIQPGLNPHGMGAARDNAGREYRIQF